MPTIVPLPKPLPKSSCTKKRNANRPLVGPESPEIVIVNGVHTDGYEPGSLEKAYVGFMSSSKLVNTPTSVAAMPKSVLAPDVDNRTCILFLAEGSSRV